MAAPSCCLQHNSPGTRKFRGFLVIAHITRSAIPHFTRAFSSPYFPLNYHGPTSSLRILQALHSVQSRDAWHEDRLPALRPQFHGQFHASRPLPGSRSPRGFRAAQCPGRCPGPGVDVVTPKPPPKSNIAASVERTGSDAYDLKPDPEPDEQPKPSKPSIPAAPAGAASPNPPPRTQTRRRAAQTRHPTGHHRETRQGPLLPPLQPLTVGPRP